MADFIYSPAQAVFWCIPGPIIFLIIPVMGIACFAYIMVKRITPLIRGQADSRLDRVKVRSARVLRFWLGQWRQPRYLMAGILHILLFAGFLVLSIRSAERMMSSDEIVTATEVPGG